MIFFDLHTHSHKAASILSSGIKATEGPCSVGIHPWEITDEWENEIVKLRSEAGKKSVVAIGECGIDKLKSPADTETQIKILTAHALLAEEVRKPLILHCVKGQEEIIKTHRDIAAKQKWIIHGFRGKAEQATQLLNEGFYLSFGARFNPEAVVATPLDRLFIESDTSNKDIEEIYSAIATLRGENLEELCVAIEKNLKICNFLIL